MFESVVKTVVMKYSRQRSKEDAEDFEQECWLILHEKRTRFDGLDETAKQKLAYTICKNAILDYISKNLPAQSEVSVDESPPLLTALELDDHLDYEKVVQEIDALPAEYREILKWRYGINREPENLADIADRLGMGVTTVHTKEKKALEMLRKKVGVWKT